MLTYRVNNLNLKITRVENYKKISAICWNILELNFRQRSSLLRGILRRREKRELPFEKLEKFDRYSSTVCHVSVDAEARDNQGASRTWPDCRDIFYKKKYEMIRVSSYISTRERPEIIQNTVFWSRGKALLRMGRVLFRFFRHKFCFSFAHVYFKNIYYQINTKNRTMIMNIVFFRCYSALIPLLSEFTYNYLKFLLLKSSYDWENDLEIFKFLVGHVLLRKNSNMLNRVSKYN